jgi:hypothetical protein
MPADSPEFPAINLTKVFPVVQPEQYKLHLACWNGENQPLDVFVRDRNEWDGWNAYRGRRNDFSRDFIFSLIDFYPERNTWLFGGVYKILSRRMVVQGMGYEVKLVDDSKPFIGRLKLVFKRPSRNKAVNFEKHYHNLIVSELLPKPYSGEAFCGYDQIDVGFSALETIVLSQRTDWRVALQNAKGVYLITDTNNGMRYVGAAYGGTGIWSRWMCYIGTGHGYNDELTRIIEKHTREYARKYFKFTLLEYFTHRTEDTVVTAREAFWKTVLLSREYGYNKN